MIQLKKTPPYRMGETACLINATIDLLGLNVDKLNMVELGLIDRTLSKMYSVKSISFISTNDLGKLWIATVEFIENLNLTQELINSILEKADTNYNHLNKGGVLL